MAPRMKESPEGWRPGAEDMLVAERELMMSLALLLKKALGADSRK
jgi:hypothetical protein